MGGNEKAKLFVGGLSQNTSTETLKEHFSSHGAVLDAIVMNDPSDGRSRGFGFVTFDKPEAIDDVLLLSHNVDGKEVDCKRACPREVMAARQYGGAHYSPSVPGLKTDKIFVGGLPILSLEEFKGYFSKYGNVIDAVLMTDKNTSRPRGFGFVTYDSTDTVDLVVRKFHDHQIKEKWVEVKKAQSKDQLMTRQVNPGQGRGFGAFGDSYGVPPYSSYYGDYHPGYPPYNTRRPYGGSGYDPYGNPGYAGTSGFGTHDNAMGRKQYDASRGAGGGYYRGFGGGGDPNGMSSAGPYRNPPGSGALYAVQHGTGNSAYPNTTYRGGPAPY